jgi:hypothetical protein
VPYCVKNAAFVPAWGKDRGKFVELGGGIFCRVLIYRLLGLGFWDGWRNNPMK